MNLNWFNQNWRKIIYWLVSGVQYSSVKKWFACRTRWGYRNHHVNIAEYKPKVNHTAFDLEITSIMGKIVIVKDYWTRLISPGKDKSMEAQPADKAKIWTCTHSPGLLHIGNHFL